MTIVVACVTVGYAALISVQIQSFSESTYDLLQKRDFHVTNLLAAQIGGGVKWRKPAAIKRAYNALTIDSESSLSSVLVLDAAGQRLDSYQNNHTGSIRLFDIIAVAAEQLEKGETYSSNIDGHIVIVMPVSYGVQANRVGTLAIAWNLTSYHARVSEELQRQLTIGIAALGALITVIVLLLNRVISRPLQTVTQTTLNITEGRTNTRIPFTERRDEIGDLGRSLLVFKNNLEIIDNLHAEQRAQTERLAAALEKEKAYNVLQSEFVAMASHEFRTPLTIIDSGAQRIERRLSRMDPVQIKDKTTQIRNAVQRMTTLIESVLSSASFDAGKFKLEVEACDLKQIVETICLRQQEISPSHNIGVDLEELPNDIMGDPRLLEQVYTNLLSNAVKYAPNNPSIDVIGFQKNNLACVAVTDRGLGIPVAEQEKIFDRYFRASTSTGIAGTGIGLNLVAQTVELHGGDIEIESDEGKGTTFTVRLPIRKSTVLQRDISFSQTDSSETGSNTRTA